MVGAARPGSRILAVECEAGARRYPPTLLGQRPVAQLNRWMVEEVLAAISYVPATQSEDPWADRPRTALRSVRVQHPGPEVAEVSAHVAIGKQSAAYGISAGGAR